VPDPSPNRQTGVVSIVLVTCNSAPYLSGVINALRRHPPTAPWELIVIDNSSDDGSPAIVEAEFPNARVIHNAENLGFARAVNQGAACANGAFLLLVNPDVSWSGTAVESLADFLGDHPRAAAVVPRLMYPDGTPQPSTRYFPNHRNIWFSRGLPLSRIPLLSRRYTIADPSSPTRVESAAATFMMTRADAFRAVGGMDGEFLLYVEDTDLCRRWYAAGWEVWIDPRTVATHAWIHPSERATARKRLHRAGLRHYFRKHYPERRLSNRIVFLGLWLGDVWDRVTDALYFRRQKHDA